MSNLKPLKLLSCLLNQIIDKLKIQPQLKYLLLQVGGSKEKAVANFLLGFRDLLKDLGVAILKKILIVTTYFAAACKYVYVVV